MESVLTHLWQAIDSRKRVYVRYRGKKLGRTRGLQYRLRVRGAFPRQQTRVVLYKQGHLIRTTTGWQPPHASVGVDMLVFPIRT